MDNLYRELAPISDAAWAQIEDEARRTLTRYLGARRVVDLHGPEGPGLSAIGTGHVRTAPALAEGVHCTQREVNPLVELRVPLRADAQRHRRCGARLERFRLATAEGRRAPDRAGRGPAGVSRVMAMPG